MDIFTCCYLQKPNKNADLMRYAAMTYTKPGTLSPKPKALNPKPETLNPKP